MPPLRILSPSEQVADHLKGELLRGRWMNSIPGVPSLAAEMGVNRKTVDAALRQLDSEGVLIPQGAGRKRLIGFSTGRSESSAADAWDPSLWKYPISGSITFLRSSIC